MSASFKNGEKGNRPGLKEKADPGIQEIGNTELKINNILGLCSQK